MVIILVNLPLSNQMGAPHSILVRRSSSLYWRCENTMQKGQRVSLISKFAGLGDLLFSGFYFSFQSPLTSTSQSQHSKAGLMTHAELFVRQQKGPPGVQPPSCCTMLNCSFKIFALPPPALGDLISTGNHNLAVCIHIFLDTFPKRGI